MPFLDQAFASTRHRIRWDSQGRNCGKGSLEGHIEKLSELTLRLALHKDDQGKHTTSDLYKSKPWCGVKAEQSESKPPTRIPVLTIHHLLCAPASLCDDEDLCLVRAEFLNPPVAKRHAPKMIPVDKGLKAVNGVIIFFNPKSKGAYCITL